MPLEALLIPDNLTHSESDDIEGGTGCIVYFFYLDRINLVSKLRKLEQKWKVSQPFLVKSPLT